MDNVFFRVMYLTPVGSTLVPALGFSLIHQEKNQWDFISLIDIFINILKWKFKTN